MAATATLVIYNTTNDDIDIDELGITVPALDSSDIAHFRQITIWRANSLVDAVSNGIIGVISNTDTTPPTLWPVDDALTILEQGINGFQIGLHKVLTPGVVDGRYYSAATNSAAVETNVSVTMDHLYAVPISFMGVPFNRIGIEVMTGVANGVIRLGIYENNNGIPGDLLLDAGYVPTDTVGEKEIVIDFTAPLDWYWLAALPNANIICETLTLSAVDNGIMGVIDGTAGDYSNVAYGPLPSSFPDFSPAWENPPLIWLRKV